MRPAINVSQSPASESPITINVPQSPASESPPTINVPQSPASVSHVITQSTCTSASICNQLLCFIQNKLHSLPVDTLVKLTVDFYHGSQVDEAKKVFFNSVITSKRKRTRRGDTKHKQDVYDIVEIFLGNNVTCPKFCATDLSNLPPINMDNVDIMHLLREIEAMKDNMNHLVSGQRELVSTVPGLQSIQMQNSTRVQRDCTIATRLVTKTREMPVTGKGISPRGINSDRVMMLFSLSQLLPSDALPSHTLPSHTLSSHTLPSHTLSSHKLPLHALPSDVLPSHALPSDSLPSDALPSHALLSNALPSHVLLSDVRGKSSRPLIPHVVTRSAQPVVSRVFHNINRGSRHRSLNPASRPQSSRHDKHSGDHVINSTDKSVIHGRGHSSIIRAAEPRQRHRVPHTPNRVCSGVFISRLAPKTNHRLNSTSEQSLA